MNFICLLFLARHWCLPSMMVRRGSSIFASRRYHEFIDPTIFFKFQTTGAVLFTRKHTHTHTRACSLFILHFPNPHQHFRQFFRIHAKRIKYCQVSMGFCLIKKKKGRTNGMAERRRIPTLTDNTLMEFHLSWTWTTYQLILKTELLFQNYSFVEQTIRLALW